MLHPRIIFLLLVSCVVLSPMLNPEASGQTRICPQDSVSVGPVCVDKYEASVWETTHAGVIKKIRNGTVQLSHLLSAGAIQRGVNSDDYDDAGCPITGNGCTKVYAVSIPGVMPSAFITWFQAVAAARNAGKRLPTNAEWQAAALGTPDPPCDSIGPEDCNICTSGPDLTGARSNCVSDVGTFDMVGNLNEWVADWLPQRYLGASPPLFGSDDDVGLAPPLDSGPGVLLRGGYFLGGGVFAIIGGAGPTGWGPATGFRGVQ